MATLRSRIIHLAQDHLDLRPHLLPLLKEAAPNKIPLTQRPPLDQVRYHVDSALRWLKAGAPSAASTSLVKAIEVATQTKAFGPQTTSMTGKISEALQVVNGWNPRAGDDLVEAILRKLPPKQP